MIWMNSLFVTESRICACRKMFIQSIASGRALPSMSEFLYICDYLDVSPKDFFDPELKDPVLLEQAVSSMKELSNPDLRLLISIIDRLNVK